MGIRTTVTLDEDVYDRLTDESTRRGWPFRQTLNEIVRQGLTQAKPPTERRWPDPPRLIAFDPELDLTSTSRLLDELEGPDRPW